LIEHQSEPDALMSMRLLEYFVQIIKAQMGAWASTHASFAGFRVQPVLPVVLYTGTQCWDAGPTSRHVREPAGAGAGPARLPERSVRPSVPVGPRSQGAAGRVSPVAGIGRRSAAACKR
jgi:hypothetical protein